MFCMIGRTKMKKEEILLFLKKLPFKIETHKGKFLTVKEVVRDVDTSLVFKDKFGSLRSIALIDIKNAHELNNTFEEETGGGSNA